MRWLLLRRDLALKRNFIMALKSINHSRYYRRPSLPEQGLMYPACMNSTMLSALDAEATICVPLGLQNNTFLQELILQGRGLLWIQSRKWTTS